MNRCVFRRLCFLVLGIGATFLLGSQVFAQAAVEGGSFHSEWGTVWKMVLLLIPILVIFIITFLSLRHISREFHKSCVERYDLDLFAKSPLGLPEGTIGASLGLVGGAIVLYLLVVILLKHSFFGAEFGFFEVSPELIKAATSSVSTEAEKLKVIDAVMSKGDEKLRTVIAGFGAIVLLVLIVLGIAFYMQRLQKRYFDTCIKGNDLKQIAGAPAGLPPGTVRAMLAILIVVVSLCFIALQFFVKGSDRIPEGLMTLLSAVVAFYFANRASSQGAMNAFASNVQGMREERDSAIAEKHLSNAEKKIGKLKNGLTVIKAGMKFLPADKRKKYEGYINKFEKGVDTAEGLFGGGSARNAVDLVSGALKEFGKNNPAYDSVKSALPVIGRVLGVGVPAIALVSALVNIGVKIGSERHQRWKRRILQAPIEAASLPVDAIDGLMASQYFKMDAILSQAFAKELSEGVDIVLKDAATDFIKLDDESLWSKYGNRFDSEEHLENAVQGFRRKITDDALRPYVESDWLAGVGTYDNLVSSVDKLHGDKESRAHLDELFLVFDGLQREGQPVLKIFEKVEEELKNEKAI